MRPSATSYTARGAFTLALGLATPALAWTPYRSESGAWLRWASPTLALELAPPPGPLDPQATLAAIEGALAAWSTAGCGAPLTSAALAADAARAPEDGRNTVTFAATSEAWSQIGSSTELARTLLIYRVRSGELVDADLVVNLAGFTFALGPACGPDDYDLRFTLTHELGHVYGLDHSDVAGATMAANTDPGLCAGHALTDDDRAGLCALYPTPPPPEVTESPEATEAAEAAEPVEADPDPSSGPRDDGCHQPPAAPLALALFAWSRLNPWRSARRANARGRRARRPSRARS